MRVDLNADVGESFGAFSIGQDAALMRSITSASIAAGFHAGDPSVLRRTIRLAREHGVAMGAHPGFPDLVGFGRRAIQVTAREAEDFTLYQIAAVAGVAAAEGVRLQHVKPHGALYNMAARDRLLADAIVKATIAFDRSLVLFAPSGSELIAAARAAKLRTASEVFADRAYRSDGSLVDRSSGGAVLTDADIVVPRAVRMIRDGLVETIDGSTLRVEVQTICLHGDTPGVGELAARLRSDLETAGITVAAFQS